MEILLEELILHINYEKRRFFLNPHISSLAYDSGDVIENSLFFALPGVHTDGHDYISRAIDNGAAAVVHSKELTDYRENIEYIKVKDTRKAMSGISAAFYGFPSKEIKVIGVTGTDGKSTTVSFIRQMLNMLGYKAGSISTVEFFSNGKSSSNIFRQSTPESPVIQKLLRDMVSDDHTHAVIEATSHGLSPKNNRLKDVNFDSAVFTNVTSEHLEFHGSLENYRKDKSELFKYIAQSDNPDAFGVINADDPNADIFIKAAGNKKVYTYGIKSNNTDLKAENIIQKPSYTAFKVTTGGKSCRTEINMPGLYNVENALAALCAASCITGTDPVKAAPLIKKLKGIKGRMEIINGNMNFNVVVDYAHSPGSFKKVLPLLKSLSRNRLIVIFGSAGERDTAKRPEQGKIASEYADIIILTDEDPRGEDSQEILKDIAKGIKNKKENTDLFLIPDRKKAIEKAVELAEKGDFIAALGKGHEKSIIYKKGPTVWDEAETIKSVLTGKGFNVSSV